MRQILCHDVRLLLSGINGGNTHPSFFNAFANVMKPLYLYAWCDVIVEDMILTELYGGFVAYVELEHTFLFTLDLRKETRQPHDLVGSHSPSDVLRFA